jgi:hypothetical protein
VELDNSNVAVYKVLSVFNDRGMKSYWKIEKNTEAYGDELYVRIHEYSDSGKLLSGEELYFILTPKVQIIEGMLLAFDKDMTLLWIVLHILDGNCIDVVSSDESIYEKIRQFYTHATYEPASKLIGDEFF